MARVWQAQPHEAETVAALLSAFNNHIGRDWPSENAFHASVERLMERREAEFLLGAPTDDVPAAAVAQMRFRFGVWYATEDCELEDLFVAEEARGSGLGRAMLEAVIARATERGCRRIQLDTNETNAAALALYESCGFKVKPSLGDGRDLLLRHHIDAG